MAYRTFVDENSRYWQVWDSHPHALERRKGDRRHSMLDWGGEDRRRADRRREARARTSLIDARFATGWLTFESFTEKRRLAPIPPHWDESSPGELIDMWERATPVSRISDESSAA